MLNYIINSKTKNIVLKKKQNITFDFELLLEEYYEKNDICLVLDIYNYNSTRQHPGDHYTWQKFNINQNEIDLKKFRNFSLNISKKDNFECNIDGKKYDEHWKNSEKVQNFDGLYLLQIILRTADASNKVLFNLKIPIFENDEVKENFYKIDHEVLNGQDYNFKNLELKNRKIYFIQNRVFRNTAVGNFFLSTYFHFKKHKYDVEIYAADFDLQYNNIITPRYLLPKKIDKNDVIIFFYYDQDDFINYLNNYENCKKILFYQNITDPELLQIFEIESANRCKMALKDLKNNIEIFDQLIANSTKTKKDLSNILKNKIAFIENVKKNNELTDTNLSDFVYKMAKIDEKFSAYFNEKNQELISNFKVRTIGQVEDSNSVLAKERFERMIFYDTSKLKDILVCPPTYKKLSIKNTNSDQNTSAKFLTVCRLAPNKKIEDTIELFYEYNKLDANSQLTIIGSSGETFYRDFLIQKIKNLKIDSKIKMIDLVSAPKLIEHYQESNFYITMSEHEGFGIPLLEAASYGCLICAYQLEAYEDIIKNSGFLFNQKNFKSISKTLNELFKKPELRKELVAKQTEDIQKSKILNETLVSLFSKIK